MRGLLIDVRVVSWQRAHFRNRNGRSVCILVAVSLRAAFVKNLCIPSAHHSYQSSLLNARVVSRVPDPEMNAVENNVACPRLLR